MRTWNFQETGAEIMRFHCGACGEIITADRFETGQVPVCAKCGRAAECPADRFAPGTIIADYEILSVLSQGDMGVIYRAKSLTNETPAALKILSKEHSYDAKFIVSFIHSGRQMMKIELKNTVKVLSVGEDEGIFYYAMEYVEGESLAAILKNRKRLSLPESLKIISALTEVLSAVWNQGKLTHKSIKPDNILISENGDLKLADLGLARDFLDLASRTDEERQRLVQYVPPEALSDFSMSELDVRSDIYSLGAVFYHMVTGQMPYQSFSAAEIISGQVPFDLLEPDRLNPEISPSLRNVILKMLARNPRDRYQNYSDLLKDLQKEQEPSEKSSAVSRRRKGKRDETEPLETVKIAAPKQMNLKKLLQDSEGNPAELGEMQRRRESRSQTIILTVFGVLLCLGIFATLFIRWIVYEPQRSAREMEINIARMKQRAVQRKSLYQPLAPGAPERLSRGVVALCSNEDFAAAQRYIYDFTRRYPATDREYRDMLLKHVRNAQAFFRELSNSGTAVAGIEIDTRQYGLCKVLSVRDSVISAKTADGKDVRIQIRTFTHGEYGSYLKSVVDKFRSYGNARSYLVCTGNFESALRRARNDAERREFEQIIFGYIRTGLSNASPLEIRQMRMLYGSLDAFQKAAHQQ